MIRPKPRSFMAGAAARAQRKTPVMLTSMTLRHSASGICSKGRFVKLENSEALFTSASMRPNAFSTTSTICPTDASSETSTNTGIARISFGFDLGRYRARVRHVDVADDRDRTRSRELPPNSRPMPWPAPVMRTTRSFTLKSLELSLALEARDLRASLISTVVLQPSCSSGAHTHAEAGRPKCCAPAPLRREAGEVERHRNVVAAAVAAFIRKPVSLPAET